MDGSVYVYEWTQNPAPVGNSGSIYVYEYTRETPQFFNGSIYAYEYPTSGTIYGTNGSVYIYEYTVPNTNPGKIRVWDGTQWVRRPDYIWNGTTWTQIV